MLSYSRYLNFWLDTLRFQRVNSPPEEINFCPSVHFFLAQDKYQGTKELPWLKRVGSLRRQNSTDLIFYQIFELLISIQRNCVAHLSRSKWQKKRLKNHGDFGLGQWERLNKIKFRINFFRSQEFNLLKLASSKVDCSLRASDKIKKLKLN